jgi:transposase
LNHELLFQPVSVEQFQTLSKEQLIEYLTLEQQFIATLRRKLKEIEKKYELLSDQMVLIDEKYILLKHSVFDSSTETGKKIKSEATAEPVTVTESQKQKPRAKTRIQLPSERYPNAVVVVQDVEFKEIPTCRCCGSGLVDSGMTEESEYLSVIPKQHVVIKQRRHKYRCKSCYGDLQTAPAPPRIRERSSYGDDMVIDAALSKYCDLIPLERYAAIAERSGISGLPPQSLIECTHDLADFLKPVSKAIESEVLRSRVLHADETPHRMLEGDAKKSWSLWGFSAKRAAYFEIHNTRSGDVASAFLEKARCEYLVSDVFSGYAKATRVANESRRQKERSEITHAYCNAHARRKFVEAGLFFPEKAGFFIDRYKLIYGLEGQAREGPSSQSKETVLKFRQQMEPIFEEMREEAKRLFVDFSSKGAMSRAISYFLTNFSGLTEFLKEAEVPIDNNAQERLLRNPVIGRKTWYGTHSKRGAETASVLYTVIETCKLNQVNPREYFKEIVSLLHAKKPIQTPAQYRDLMTG